jgi:hypothetical protein
MRRVGQVLRGQLSGQISEAVQAEYIDYATAKAAGQDLGRFRQNPPTQEVMPAPQDWSRFVCPTPIGDDYDGLSEKAIPLDTEL